MLRACGLLSGDSEIFDLFVWVHLRTFSFGGVSPEEKPRAQTSYHLGYLSWTN